MNSFLPFSFFFVTKAEVLCHRTMKPTVSKGMFCVSLILLLFCCLALSNVINTTERRAADEGLRTRTNGSNPAAAGQTSSTLFLLTGYKSPKPSGLKVAPKAAEMEDDPPAVAELPPKPLPQIMLPRNVTADALKPPLGAANVAPPPKQLVDVDVCRCDYVVCSHS